ncbi:DUF512 domain-containing protein [Eubacteriaceae bacterium ES2]|nr:DUF512 domain-containing protein [Eubacteriaceae bacterium ES2]
MKKFVIKSVEEDSIAAEMELKTGDVLLSINGNSINDILDYRYLISDETLLVEIEKTDGEIWELEIEKEFEEDLGLHFAEDQINTKTCKNNCVFCFIDQLPKGLRKSLYVKDDDERLSFLTGNYITLTNLTDDELKRIISFRIMPINISIHTTNPELRCKMLNNRFAGSVLAYLDQFKENGIQMNGQIVLVPGYNDENELVKTLDDLKEYFPVLQSISVVPVGISRFREGLSDLKAFSQEQAKRTVEIINAVQRQMREDFGVGFVYPSDEFFKLARIPFPTVDYYDEFLQIENGVGMVADFKCEFLDKLAEQPSLQHNNKIGILTGFAAFDELEDLISQLKQKYSNIKIEVLPIINNFFGEKITVSGLMTGKDIIEQIKPILERSKYDYLLIPENALKKDTELMLDDVNLKSLGKILNVPVIKTKVNGGELIETIFKL